MIFLRPLFNKHHSHLVDPLSAIKIAIVLFSKNEVNIPCLFTIKELGLSDHKQQAGNTYWADFRSAAKAFTRKFSLAPFSRNLYPKEDNKARQGRRFVSLLNDVDSIQQIFGCRSAYFC